MCCYWKSYIWGKRKEKVKRGGPHKGCSQKCGTEVLRINSGRRKYLLGGDILVGNEGVNEGWFLLLEEGLCDQHYVDLDANTILLNLLGFNESEGVLLDR